MQTMIGLFDNRAMAQAAYQALLDAGFHKTALSLLGKDDEAELAALGYKLPTVEAAFYVESASRGGTLVLVDCVESEADKAVDIMRRNGMVDVDARLAELSAREYPQEDYVLPVVEETLEVDKRQVERGRVRITNRVSSRDVEEQVGLRDETVRVQRRAVNRQAIASDLDAFTEKVFEIVEIDEEAVVTKKAVVIEEVVISKDVVEKIETIHETLRRSDVEIEQVKAAAVRSLEDHAGDLERFYASKMADLGMTFEQFMPVFQYGYSLAKIEQFQGKDWNAIAKFAREKWEERNPGSWERFAEAIRYAYDLARSNAS